MNYQHDEVVEIYKGVEIRAINNCNTIFGFVADNYTACETLEHLKSLIDNREVIKK